jgi:hypothetical protein
MLKRVFPRTINERIQTLSQATSACERLSTNETVISISTKDKLYPLFLEFKEKLINRDHALANQADDSEKEDVCQRKLKMLVSHFLMVFNLGVKRGLYEETDRTYYSLHISQSKLPKMNGEGILAVISLNVIMGEKNRLKNNNAIPMQNPSADELEQAYNAFMDISTKQSVKKELFFNANKLVLDMLPEIDELIKDIYSEVYFFYRKESNSSRRKLAKMWGIIYRYTERKEKE